ncbi:MAG TPA: universal stress protein [Anaerolineales bacterium]
MSEQPDQDEIIRRILVALDASPHSLAALRAAAELAANMDAELLGMFVEDINLLRLAELPFARQVSSFSAEPRSLSREQVEQQLRSQARTARRAMENLVGSSRLRWSFRVTQGVIAGELLSAAEQTDLIILGKAGWSHGRRLGSTARLVVTQAASNALVLQHGVQLGLPVGVVFDGSPQSQRALEIAARLLRRREAYHLLVVLLAGDAEQARYLQGGVTRWLRSRDLQASYRWLLERSGKKLAAMIEGERQRCMLVLPAESQFLPPETILDLLNHTECPVLVVR